MKNQIARLALFALISMILLSLTRKIYPRYHVLSVLPREFEKPDITGIYVPPAQFSHPKCCASVGRIDIPNTWRNLPPDNNIPGLLPGPRFGETLGLNNNPDLSLETPIKAPILDSPKIKKANPNVLKCLNKAINDSQSPTLTSEGYYRKRFEQCNPYNGSYCQCTNNYIPLPTVGMCQAYNRGMEVCPYPYKVPPADVYEKTMRCLNPSDNL